MEDFKTKIKITRLIEEDNFEICALTKEDCYDSLYVELRDMFPADNERQINLNDPRNPAIEIKETDQQRGTKLFSAENLKEEGG
jgi:hypothetical protein